MGVSENLDIIRRGYVAFGSGDVETLRSLFAEDAVHSVPGDSPIGGDHKGIDNILGMYGQLAIASQGFTKVELQNALSDGGNRVIAIQRATMTVGDKVLDQIEALLFTIEDGRIVNVEDFFSDVEATDAYFTSILADSAS
jgi:ketosteroid isomerase-like protein